MDSVELWNAYHQAIQIGNMDQARQLMVKIQTYKGKPPLPQGGCTKCRKRMY